MNHSRRLIFCMLAACLGSSMVAATAHAQLDHGRENFLSSAESLVPPNCLSDPLPTPAGTITQGVVPFPVTENINGPQTSVRIQLWRTGCHEPNRTALLLRFENVSGDFLAAPFLGPLLIGNESNGFSSATYRLRANDFSMPTQLDLQTSWFLNNGVSDPYLIEIGPLLSGQPANELDIDEYQQAFGLTFLAFNSQGGLTDISTVEIPAASQSNSVTQFAEAPLTGRLSGAWVAANAADQGILLNIIELANRRLLVFFTWFTYGLDGEPAWFTGNDFFEIGDNQISFDLIQTGDGQFQGSLKAQRITVGSATLRSIDCAQFEFQFDLSTIGLGSDTIILERLFAAETAGYACRDLPARKQ